MTSLKQYGVTALVIGAGYILSTTISVADTQLDSQLNQLIQQHKLTGNPAAGRQIPSIHSPEAQLGKVLFFNKGLSGNKDVACVSCHHPLLGGGDDLSLPVGVDALSPNLLGPGRLNPEHQPLVPRNSPTTFNTALWDKFMFWDGRIESLDKTPGANGSRGSIRTPDSKLGTADPLAGKNLVHAQARFPITSKEEMRSSYLDDIHQDVRNQTVREYLAGRLGGYMHEESEQPLHNSRHWVMLFENIYGKADSVKELITEQRISQAISEYERSQLFVNNAWNNYIKGDKKALSNSAKRGALLFYRNYNQGGANCVACHSGDKFTDEGFYNIAAPQIGPGNRGGINDSGDFGRVNETYASRDIYKFRTPSLLNIEGTAPYTHAGAYLNLRDVIRHHLNPAAAIAEFDIQAIAQHNPGIKLDMMQANTQLVLRHLQYEQRKNQTVLRTQHLGEQQITDLENFLRSLTDPCIKSAKCLAPWIDDSVDPNGLALEARFQLN